MRSQRNVDDSDGTIAFRLKPSVGTDKTIGYCLFKKWACCPSSNFQALTKYKSGLVVTDLSPDCESDTVMNIVSFIRQHNITILNIAGHRDSTSVGVANFQARVQHILEAAFKIYLSVQ